MQHRHVFKNQSSFFNTLRHLKSALILTLNKRKRLKVVWFVVVLLMFPPKKECDFYLLNYFFVCK